MNSVEHMQSKLNSIQNQIKWIQDDLEALAMDRQDLDDALLDSQQELNKLKKDESSLLAAIKDSTTKKYYLNTPYVTRMGDKYWLVPHVSARYAFDGVMLLCLKTYTTKNGWYKTEVFEDDNGLYVTGLPTCLPGDFGPDTVALKNVEID